MPYHHIVYRPGVGYTVTDMRNGGQVAGPFDTRAEGQAWIDEQ